MSMKGDETKLRILHAAADLFHKQGIRATSPDEIIEASRTGKGQFYHYFKNKAAWFTRSRAGTRQSGSLSSV
jgi:AcrR family transcriptional regulator